MLGGSQCQGWGNTDLSLLFQIHWWVKVQIYNMANLVWRKQNVTSLMGTESTILSFLVLYSNRNEEQCKWMVILEIIFKFNPWRTN